MPQSFTKRFTGREEEIVDQIKLDGWWKFCQHEGITGFSISLQNWFQNQKGCKNDSILSYISSDSPVQDLPLAKQILLAIQAERSRHQAIVDKYKARIEETNRRIEFLEEQLRFYRLNEYRDLRPIWEMVNNRGQ